MQIIETPHETLEIADAIPIGIHIRRHRQTINYRVLVPEIVDHELNAPLFLE
jgi:hypothetical protein